MHLKDYYKTPWWKSFRLNLTNKKDCSCEICGKPRWIPYKNNPSKYKTPLRIEVHHMEYNLFKENRNEVMTLCRSCHQLLHSLEMMARTRKGIFAKLYSIVLDETPWKFKKYDKS